MALLIMTAGMLHSVWALTTAYFSYPVSVSISVRRELDLVFPAVTICNMSPVKKSAMQAADLPGTSKRRKRLALEEPFYTPLPGCEYLYTLIYHQLTFLGPMLVSQKIF